MGSAAENSCAHLFRQIFIGRFYIHTVTSTDLSTDCRARVLSQRILPPLYVCVLKSMSLAELLLTHSVNNLSRRISQRDTFLRTVSYENTSFMSAALYLLGMMKKKSRMSK